MIADALSRKTQHNLSTVISIQPGILRDLEDMGIELILPGLTDGLLSTLEVQPLIAEEIKARQKDDALLEKLR